MRRVFNKTLKCLATGMIVALVASLLTVLLPTNMPPLPVGIVLANPGDVTWAVTNPVFEDGNSLYFQVCELDTNKFVVVYMDSGDGDAGKARVGTVSGTTITWGDISEFCSDVGISRQLSVNKLDTDKFVVVYADDFDGDVGKVILGNVSTRTIAWEDPVGYSGTNHAEYPGCTTLSSTKFAIVYNDETSGDVGTAVICTVATDIITADTANALAFEGMTVHSRCCKLDTDKFVAFYADAGDSSYGKACAFSVSTTTPTAGAILVIDGVAVSNNGDCIQLDTDKFVAVWRQGKMVICTVDGALDITADAGGNVTFNGGDEVYFTGLAKIDATHFVITYQDLGNANKGTSRYCSFSGTTITLDGEEIFCGNDVSYTDVCLISNNKVVAVYQDRFDANKGKAIIGDMEAAIVAPTVTTEAADDIEDTTATGNGTVTDLGGGTTDRTGIVWDLATQGAPGNVAPGASGYANDVGTDGNPGLGAFDEALTGLPTGDTIYCRAYAHTENGYGYGDEVSFLTKPAAPTNVSATDGAHTDKVVITWTKSTGATDYHVWRDAVDLGAAGDVATFDDSSAAAPTITPGTTSASNGDSPLHITITLIGASVNNGTTHTYKVVASNATGDSDDSLTDIGYRGVGALTYQWQRSAADSDATYGNIGEATTDPYDDTAAPAPIIGAGAADASDGTSNAHVTLSIAGDSASDGDGRWYQCVLDATGAAQETSVSNRGYRGTTDLTYEWFRSATDSDAAYGSIAGEGGTTDPYNDTNGAIDPEGRWYYAMVSMSGAVAQSTTHDRGYIAVAPLPGAPTDFTLTVNGNDVDISWTMGSDATTTVIVRQTGRYPEDRDDGVTVLDGAGTLYTDDTVNLDDTEYYYRAWSHNATGYSVDYAEGTIGGRGMLTIAIALFVLGFTVLAVWRREAVFYMLGTIGWLFTTFYMVNLDYPADNAYLPYAIAGFCLSATLVMAIQALRVYFSSRVRSPTSSEIQAEHRRKVLGLTNRRSEKKWFEE